MRFEVLLFFSGKHFCLSQKYKIHNDIKIYSYYLSLDIRHIQLCFNEPLKNDNFFILRQHQLRK